MVVYNASVQMLAKSCYPMDDVVEVSHTSRVSIHLRCLDLMRSLVDGVCGVSIPSTVFMVLVQMLAKCCYLLRRSSSSTLVAWVVSLAER